MLLKSLQKLFEFPLAFEDIGFVTFHAVSVLAVKLVRDRGCLKVGTANGEGFLGKSALALDYVHLFMELLPVVKDNAVGFDSFSVEWRVELRLGRLFRLCVGVSATKRSGGFRDKTVSLKQALGSARGDGADGKPVAHAVLINSNLAGHGLLRVRRPRAELLKMTAVKLLIDRLGDKPPIAVSVQALVQELNAHPHFSVKL